MDMDMAMTAMDGIGFLSMNLLPFKQYQSIYLFPGLFHPTP
jgi:hypothetical protein